MTNEMNNNDQAVWREVRRLGHSNEITVVKELYSDKMHVTKKKTFGWDMTRGLS